MIMKNKRWIYFFVGVILLFLLWFALAEIIQEKKLIFPGPIETFKEFFQILKKASTYQSIFMTLYKTFLGFVIAFVLAFIFGTIAGIFPQWKDIFTPLLVLLRAIPTASVVFLFLVIAGVKNSPLYVVILITFPVLYDSFVGGIENISKKYLDIQKLEGKLNLKSIFSVYIPLAIPMILIGITSAFGLALKVEIMAEIISGDTTLGNGIGVAIHQVQIMDVNMAPIFAWSFIAILLLCFVTLLGNILKKKLKKSVL